MKKKLKIGGVLDFTADFGLKVSQVTAGFGYGEGYYERKKKILCKLAFRPDFCPDFARIFVKNPPGFLQK